MHTTHLALAAIVLALLSLPSCALKPVTTEYDYISATTKDVRLDELGDGKVLIYNGSPRFSSTRHERSNVWINGKGLGQLQLREYVIVDLEEGDHQFEVHRHDGISALRIRQQEVTIDENTKVIRVAPVWINVVQPIDELPRRFDRFTYARNENIQ